MVIWRIIFGPSICCPILVNRNFLFKGVGFEQPQKTIRFHSVPNRCQPYPGNQLCHLQVRKLLDIWWAVSTKICFLNDEILYTLQYKGMIMNEHIFDVVRSLISPHGFQELNLPVCGYSTSSPVNCSTLSMSFKGKTTLGCMCQMSKCSKTIYTPQTGRE